MKNKKKLIICCCFIVLVILAIVVFSFGHRSKYDKITRESAENTLKAAIGNKNLSVTKVSKLKYLSTFYNKESDTNRIWYFAKVDTTDKKDNTYFLIEVDIIGENLQGKVSYVTDYGVETTQKEILANRHVNDKIVEDDEGIWTKVD